MTTLTFYCRYYAFAGTFVMAFVGGYTVFLPGNWNITTFLFSYAMIGIVPMLFLFWKFFHKTQVGYPLSPSMLHSKLIHDVLVSGENWRMSHSSRRRERRLMSMKRIIHLCRKEGSNGFKIYSYLGDRSMQTALGIEIVSWDERQHINFSSAFYKAWTICHVPIKCDCLLQIRR
jgi:hypothetical protein